MIARLAQHGLTALSLVLTPTPTDNVPDVGGGVQQQVVDVLVDLGRLDEWDCIDQLYDRESGWNPNGYGDRSIGGSYGLPQRHAPVWGRPPDPWPVADQVAWTLAYADQRYGGMCEAWDAWKSRAHMTDHGWRGGWW